MSESTTVGGKIPDGGKPIQELGQVQGKAQSSGPVKVGGKEGPEGQSSKETVGPVKLPNGDIQILFDEDAYLKGLSNQGLSPAIIAARHNLKILDRLANGSERYRFLVDCSCGFQARCYTEAEARGNATRHLEIRGYRNA